LPGESWRKRAKDRYRGSKEKGKDRDRAMYVRKRITERGKSRRARESRQKRSRVWEKVSDVSCVAGSWKRMTDVND